MQNTDVINKFINNILPENRINIDSLTPKADETIDGLIKTEIINKIQEPPVGFYVTKSFFKTIDSTKVGSVYEKPLPEKSRKNKSSNSDIVKLDNAFLKEIGDGLSLNTDSYCKVVFPLVISSDNIFLLYLEIKKLPIDFNFFFFPNGNSVTTTPKVNGQNLDNLQNQIIFNKYFEDQSFVKSAYDWKLYKVKDGITYSDFIIDNKKGFTEIATEESISDIKFKKDQNNLVITFSKKGNLIITNKNESASKKIHHFDKPAKGEKYWQNFLGDGYGAKKVEDDKDKIKSANYFDISFDCQILKPFIFSNHSPGFHVIQYLPSAIYKTFINDNDSEYSITTDISEVYKAIFLSKIIQIDLTEITL